MASPPAAVLAHITGTVWKIEVAEGEQVAEGQVCVILESMKMEMPIEASSPGKVEKVHVVEGQAVSEGELLVTLV
jgi:acetyl-CoA carboxylase biotin carboxyl carrier protein